MRNADNDSNAYSDGYIDFNANGYLYSYTNGDVYADEYTYGDASTDRDGDSNSYAYFDTETFTNAEIRANA